VLIINPYQLYQPLSTMPDNLRCEVLKSLAGFAPGGLENNKQQDSLFSADGQAGVCWLISHQHINLVKGC